MRETVRAYAAERFAALPDRQSVRERHFRYYLALAHRDGTASALCGPGRDTHLARLDVEVENLRAALNWAAERDAGEVLELSVALVEYWMQRGRYADAVAWIERALRTRGAALNPVLRFRALWRLSWPLWALGRGAEAPALLSQAEAIARTLDDPVLLSEVLYNRAALTSYQGALDVACSLADEALRLARAAGERWTIAMAAWARALAAASADELRERVDQAASLLEQAGNLYHLADVFHMAGNSSLRRACDDEAVGYLQRAVPLVRRLNQPYLWMLLRGQMGAAALFTGDTQGAQDAFREELALCRELVVLPAASLGLAGLAAVAVLHGDLARAARLCGAAAAHHYGQPHGPVQGRLRARYLEPARTGFGPDTWDAAVRAGSALSFKQAIDYAVTNRANTPVPSPPLRPLPRAIRSGPTSDKEIG